MSMGFYRMGSSVPGKVMPKIIFAEPGVALPMVVRLSTPPAAAESIAAVSKPTMPALADTMIGTTLTNDQARAQGYTGNQCQTCQSHRMKVAGHCEVCEDCGSSSGCS